MTDDYDAESGEILSRPWRWSEPANEIFAALAKAQADVKRAARDSTNPHFKSSYSDLGSVLDACGEALSTNNIAVIQMPVNGQGPNVGIVTLLAHSSGQWIESTIYVAPARFDAQGVGSVITYLRRYALAAMARVAPADDDGEAAVGRPVGTDAAHQRPPARPAVASAAKPDPGRAAWEWLGEAIRNADSKERLADLDPRLIDEQRNPAWDSLKQAHVQSYEKRVALWHERWNAFQLASA
jgi:hypothetical protein